MNNWKPIEKDASGRVPDLVLKSLSHRLPVLFFCAGKSIYFIDTLTKFDDMYEKLLADTTHYLVLKSPMKKSRSLHGLMKVPAEALLKCAQEDNESLKAELSAVIQENIELRLQNSTLRDTIDKMENLVEPEEIRAIRIQAKAINKANQDFESLRKTTVSQAERIRQLKTTNRELLDRILKLQNQ